LCFRLPDVPRQGRQRRELDSRRQCLRLNLKPPVGRTHRTREFRGVAQPRICELLDRACLPRPGELPRAHEPTIDDCGVDAEFVRARVSSPSCRAVEQLVPHKLPATPVRSRIVRHPTEVVEDDRALLSLAAASKGRVPGLWFRFQLLLDAPERTDEATGLL